MLYLYLISLEYKNNLSTVGGAQLKMNYLKSLNEIEEESIYKLLLDGELSLQDIERLYPDKIKEICPICKNKKREDKCFCSKCEKLPKAKYINKIIEHYNL